jgi:hypothetical protein
MKFQRCKDKQSEKKIFILSPCPLINPIETQNYPLWSGSKLMAHGLDGLDTDLKDFLVKTLNPCLIRVIRVPIFSNRPIFRRN